MKKSEVTPGSIVSVRPSKRSKYRTNGRILHWTANKTEVIVEDVVTGAKYCRSPQALWVIVK